MDHFIFSKEIDHFDFFFDKKLITLI